VAEHLRDYSKPDICQGTAQGHRDSDRWLCQVPLQTSCLWAEFDGIPRVLDAGQCNDSYSLVVIALNA
jgi:hypothetical protein